MLISTLLKGIIIGILVSAPMGPIGVLCIRRALHKGRMEGFLSGIGATLSDLVYASITYLGIGIVVGFIEDNNPIFSALGSLFMLGFAFYIWRAKTAFNVRDQDSSTPTKHSRTIISAFLLTLSNPLIVFVYIAFFARFSIIPEGVSHLLGYIVAMTGIALGAIGWWWLITWLVSRLRDRISVVGVAWFNRIVAIVFALVAIIGVISIFFD